MPIEYKNLEVWQLSRQLVKECYVLINKLPRSENYALCDQMRRAVISIPANIAEGHGRATDKEFAKFLGYSRGSLYELETELIACVDLGYLNEANTQEIFSKIQRIAKMLNSLIRTVRNRLAEE